MSALVGDEERAAMFALLAEGTPAIDVAREVGRSPSTVWRAAKAARVPVDGWRQQRRREADELAAVLRERVRWGDVSRLARRTGLARRTVHRVLAGRAGIAATELVALEMGIPV